jgi:hypothetical protein
MTVTTVLGMLFLMGFMGMATDFGHLFVVKTELQTAADSCALAAVQELDGGSDALTRATSIGKAVGNLNKVNFQGASAGFVDTDITFSDTLNGSYSHTFAPVANARYAKCTHTKSGMQPWLFQALTAFSGNTTYSATQGVQAFGVATRASGQNACNALPVQIKPKSPASACVSPATPFYGYCTGVWIPSIYNENNNNTAPANGQFGWGNLDGSNSASELKAEVLGNTKCNLKVGDTVGTPGGKFSASVEWNTRFGLYKNGAGNPAIADAPPDTTGYAYTSTNWPTQKNASGDFLARRADFRSYGDLADSVSAGNTLTGLNVSNSYKDNEMATHAAGLRALATNGRNRRLAIAPVVTTSTITAWACVLILAPIDKVNTTVYLELVGDASASTSPCASLGLAGGTAGPLVPALVQ